ncbi:MAG TPA: hypothetical protein VIY48_13775 [Candidatus Paceibacterota bacterium]
MAGIPNIAEAKRYAVNRSGIEGIRQSLYDFNLYPTAGTNQILAFSQPQGAGVSTTPGITAGSAKNIADTNMELAGQIPAGKSFLATSIEVLFMPGSVSTANTYTLASPAAFAVAAAAAVAAQLADINIFYQSGSLKLFIGSKTYLEEAPLMRFPPKAQFKLDASLATNSATVGEIAAMTMRVAGRPYMLEPPVLLENNQNFSAQLNWPSVVATPSGFNGRVGVILDGYLYRNSQ